MSPSTRNDMEQVKKGDYQMPSIPILQCRWGLGEGVSPMVFKPLTIPEHLLRSQEDPPEDPSRRMRGRGRAAGLSCHTDPLPVPGNFTNVGVSNLTIREQIDRVRDDLPIYEPPTDYSQYILPRRSSQDDDDEAAESALPAAGPPPRQVLNQISAQPRQRGGWAEALDPFGEVAAVESSLLPQSVSGGGDAGLRALERYNRGAAGDDSDDIDVLEERTNTSDSSDEWRPARVWRPRPPALDEGSFPSLPGAAGSPVRPLQPGQDRSPSGQRQPVTTAGGGNPTGRRKTRNVGRGQKTPPAAVPKVTSVVPSPGTSSAGVSSDDAATRSSGTGQPAPEDKIGGRVYVTGVTDDNWEAAEMYVTQYGTVERSDRGPHGDGWFTISPAENAEWLVSVHTSSPCDVPGIAFQLADDETGHC